MATPRRRVAEGRGRGHPEAPALYDGIVRLGGDEFLCVMPGAAMESARERFEAIESALAGGPERAAIRVGVASLAPPDSAAALIRRADAGLTGVGRQGASA